MKSVKTKAIFDWKSAISKIPTFILRTDKMEKLLNLLNEYWKDEIERDETEINRFYTWIISKKFWFIKWLVENDKIDLVNVIKNIKWCPFDTHYWNMNKYECILMALSISDTPIEDLISYLKIS